MAETDHTGFETMPASGGEAEGRPVAQDGAADAPRAPSGRGGLKGLWDPAWDVQDDGFEPEDEPAAEQERPASRIDALRREGSTSAWLLAATVCAMASVVFLLVLGVFGIGGDSLFWTVFLLALVCLGVQEGDEGRRRASFRILAVVFALGGGCLTGFLAAAGNLMVAVVPLLGAGDGPGTVLACAALFQYVNYLSIAALCAAALAVAGRFDAAATLRGRGIPKLLLCALPVVALAFAMYLAKGRLALPEGVEPVVDGLALLMSSFLCLACPAVAFGRGWLAIRDGFAPLPPLPPRRCRIFAAVAALAGGAAAALFPDAVASATIGLMQALSRIGDQMLAGSYHVEYLIGGRMAGLAGAAAGRLAAYAAVLFAAGLLSYALARRGSGAKGGAARGVLVALLLAVVCAACYEGAAVVLYNSGSLFADEAAYDAGIHAVGVVAAAAVLGIVALLSPSLALHTGPGSEGDGREVPGMGGQDGEGNPGASAQGARAVPEAEDGARGPDIAWERKASQAGEARDGS